MLQCERSTSATSSRKPGDGGGKTDVHAQLRVMATENASLLRRVLIAEARSSRLEERNANLVRELNDRRKLMLMKTDVSDPPKDGRQS